MHSPNRKRCIYENYAAMVVSPAVSLPGDLDKIRIVREYDRSDLCRSRQLNFIRYARVVLVHMPWTPRLPVVATLRRPARPRSHRYRLLAEPSFCSRIDGCAARTRATFLRETFHSLSSSAL
jgi:hypothetical protein